MDTYASGTAGTVVDLLRSCAGRQPDAQAYVFLDRDGQPQDRCTFGELDRRAAAIARHFAPFDYGRIEFRLDPASGEIHFIELNLNCNLWPQKSVATAARLVGMSHADLFETLLAEAWRRHGLLP